MLLYDLRFIIAITVSGNGQFDIALAAADRFLAAAIATVVRLFVLVIVFAVTQLFVQLCVHGFLYKPCGEFFHQRLNTSNIFDASFLNELSHQALFPFYHFKKTSVVLFYLTTEAYTIFSAVSLILQKVKSLTFECYLDLTTSPYIYPSVKQIVSMSSIILTSDY